MFLLKWMDNWFWFVNIINGMICIWCFKYGMNIDNMKLSFIIGCKLYKIDVIIKYEEFKIYLRFREIEVEL